MSKTFKSNNSRGSFRIKHESGYKGWWGEEAWAAKTRKWFKRVVHKMNRQFAKRQIESEF